MAGAGDAAEAAAIYAQYIATPISFEYQLPTVEEMAGRIEATLAEYPYLVAEEGRRLLGYAYAHRQMAREAYQWNAELSIYLDRTATDVYKRQEQLPLLYPPQTKPALAPPLTILLPQAAQ